MIPYFSKAVTDSDRSIILTLAGKDLATPWHLRESGIKCRIIVAERNDRTATVQRLRAAAYKLDEGYSFEAVHTCSLYGTAICGNQGIEDFIIHGHCEEAKIQRADVRVLYLDYCASNLPHNIAEVVSCLPNLRVLAVTQAKHNRTTASGGVPRFSRKVVDSVVFDERFVTCTMFIFGN
jgi:hypothetical protein